MKTNKPLHLTLREAVRRQINTCDDCGGLGEAYATLMGGKVIDTSTTYDCPSCKGKGYIEPLDEWRDEEGRFYSVVKPLTYRELLLLLTRNAHIEFQNDYMQVVGVDTVFNLDLTKDVEDEDEKTLQALIELLV